MGDSPWQVLVSSPMRSTCQSAPKARALCPERPHAATRGVNGSSLQYGHATAACHPKPRPLLGFLGPGRPCQCQCQGKHKPAKQAVRAD